MRPWIFSWLFPTAKKKPTYSQVLQGLLDIRARCPHPGSPDTPLFPKEIVAMAVALAFLVKNARTTSPQRNHKPPQTYKDILVDIQREFNTILVDILPEEVYVVYMYNMYNSPTPQATTTLPKQVLIKNIVVPTANEKFQEFFPSRRLQRDIQSFLPSTKQQQHTSAG